MRPLVVGAVSVLLLSGAVRATTPQVVPPKTHVIEWFKHLQTTGTHKDLLEQTKQLEAEHLKAKIEDTDAVLLSGACGVAGCGSIYLVTTPFESPGANTKTKVLGAIVTVNALDTCGVQRVFSQEEIERLVGR